MKQIAAFTDIFRVDVYCIGSWLDYDEGMDFLQLSSRQLVRYCYTSAKS